MGVLDRAKRMSGFGGSTEDPLPYRCLACETQLDVQYHRCPVCGGYDVRSAEWLRE